MRDLNRQFKQLCKQCREGSYATQRNRERILTQVANELHAMGNRKMQARSKVKDITQSQFDKAKDEHVRIELQRVFGLRREKAMKFQPSYADWKDHIQLKANWTKAGLSRLHGLRHAYVQKRYEELTGQTCPVTGGSGRKKVN